MSVPYQRHMNQTATYWPPGENDGFGNLSFASVTPRLVQCRWEDKTVLFRDSAGQQVTSESIVYTDEPVELRGYLAPGDQMASGAADPRSLAGAREIRRADRSPSLSAVLELWKAYL